MPKFDETPIIKDPAVKGQLRPPKIREHASADVHCYLSKPKDTSAIDLPTERVPNWQARAIEKFGELLEKNQALRVYMDSCVRCGACTDKCQFFLGTGDPQNFPVARAELMQAARDPRMVSLAGTNGRSDQSRARTYFDALAPDYDRAFRG